MDKENEYPKAQWDCGKWRFEFMRRDPEYLKACEKVKELRKQTEYPHDYYEKKKGKFVIPYFSTLEGKQEQEICEKFGLQFMLLSDLDLNQPISENAWYWNMYKGAVSFWSDPKNVAILNIRIDLNGINSINAVKRHISDYVQNAFEMLPIRSQKYEQKYSLIKEVGELKQQKEWTEEAIARELIPEHYERNASSAVKKINNCAKPTI